MPDKKISCKNCSKEFVLTNSEQKDFAQKGLNEPKRCPECRAAKKVTTSLPESSTFTASSSPARSHKGISSRYNSTYNEERLTRLPAGYLSEGYFDKNGLPHRKIYAAEARHVAAALSACNTTSTRLRSFYNKILAINHYLEQSGNFESARAKLNGFLAAVEYAKNREVVPQLFQEFVNHNLTLVQDFNSFNAFLEHYKSIIAYAKTEKNFIAADWLTGRGLPAVYLSAGYFDGNGNLLREVLIEWPKAMVDIFAQASPSLSSAALRRFYNKLKGLENKLKFNREFSRILPDLYAFERDAAYAAARSVVPGVFIGFTVKNIDLAIRDEKGFKGFVEHFQSIVAFAKGKLKEGGSRQ